ncbi:type II secretion system protein GspL [Novosphingobium tardum]|uniref:Type II secretion system protein GspL n=1 Tax=Novosphingobium tardum TaxID=1538021 RepID=A0ABV8RNJ2_9SPHN
MTTVDYIDGAEDGPGRDGLIVLLPSVPGEEWRWWRVEDQDLGAEHGFTPGEDRPWGHLGDEARVVALVPSAMAPVRVRPRGTMPLAQALAAARLEAADGAPGPMHVAVAEYGGSALLVATVSTAAMDLWFAELAAAGLVPAALVPAALVLPYGHDDGTVVGQLGNQALARTPEAAFAGEPDLVEALGGGEQVAVDDLENALLATWEDPALNLRQGIYAPRRVSFFRLPDWVQLARMTAIAALLGFLVLATETVKLNLDARAREDAALEAAQKRFPAAVDLASATSLASAELARRGEGGGSFTAPASALLAAMRPIPSVSLRDLGYVEDGTLRFQAAAPTADAVNQLLMALQRDGWQVTVPPQLAPDPTGATVAAITVRAP